MFYNLNKEESADEEFMEELSPGGASEEGFNRELNEEPLRQNRDQGGEKKSSEESSLRFRELIE